MGLRPFTPGFDVAISASRALAVSLCHFVPEVICWQAELVAVEEAANTAFLERDLARLDQLFSEELLVIGHVRTHRASPRCAGASPTSGARRAIAGGSISGTPT
jgi:hypothetical protein